LPIIFNLDLNTVSEQLLVMSIATECKLTMASAGLVRAVNNSENQLCRHNRLCVTSWHIRSLTDLLHYHLR